MAFDVILYTLLLQEPTKSFSRGRAPRTNQLAMPYNNQSRSNGAPYSVQTDPVPPRAREASGEWEIALFGCCAMPGHCCMALFFPCVNATYSAHWIAESGWISALAGIYFFVTYTAAILLSNAREQSDGSVKFFSYTTEDDYYYYSSSRRYASAYIFSEWNGIAIVCALMFGVGVIVLRRAVRKFYHIQGSAITDCCASAFCSCCVLSQLSAHTERAKKSNGSASTLPAYRRA